MVRWQIRYMGEGRHFRFCSCYLHWLSNVTHSPQSHIFEIYGSDSPLTGPSLSLLYFHDTTSVTLECGILLHYSRNASWTYVRVHAKNQMHEDTSRKC